jgi:REP element-mobilizing transposase RayT
VRYDPDKHHRRSIRLRGYDYARGGAYFVTVVSQQRAGLFGDVLEDEVMLNEAGTVIVAAWMDLPERFPTASIDAFVVMPNHFHGIIVIHQKSVEPVGAGLVPALVRAPTGERERAPTRGAPTGGDRLPTLGDIVGAFKSITTRAYMEGVRHRGWQPFDKRLWQRNYYERVVRSEGELDRIRGYIDQNPLNWARDHDNPAFGETIGRAKTNAGR